MEGMQRRTALQPPGLRAEAASKPTVSSTSTFRPMASKRRKSRNGLLYIVVCLVLVAISCVILVKNAIERHAMKSFHIYSADRRQIPSIDNDRQLVQQTGAVEEDEAENVRPWAEEYPREDRPIKFSDRRFCKDPVQYLCESEAYDDFGKKLKKMVSNFTKNGFKNPEWGLRPLPLPKPHQRILFMGNSHMRQIFFELVCQYEDRTVHKSCPIEKFNSVCEITLENNVTLVGITNHYLVYSHKWDKLLGTTTGHPLRSFDALILSKFNGPKGDNKFGEWIRNITEVFHLDVSLDEQPPVLVDFLKKFKKKKPVIYFSTFARYAHRRWELNVKEARTWLRENKQKKSRLATVDGRSYVPELGECGSNQSGGIGTCEDLPEAHRCVGLNGGHPSLVVWDIIESLYKTLG